MADWRDGIPNVGKPNDGSKKPTSASPSKAPAAVPGGSGWRAKEVKPAADKGSKGSNERNWTGAGQTDVPQSRIGSKGVIVTVLGLAIAGLTFGFIRWVFSNDPRLPLFAHVATLDDAYDLGVNPFGPQIVEKLIGLSKTQNIKTVNLGMDSSDKILQLPDQFVEDVVTSDDWLKKYRKDYAKQIHWRWLNKDSLRGGGPGGDVTAYFISCYLVRESSDKKQKEHESWRLVTRSADPYKQGGDDSQYLVSIKTFLERIASRTSPGRYAWIAFDVKPPSVVTNVADLEFPATAFEEAFKELDPKLQARLIVTLPCSQSEESWIAPELSNSVFGHFFLEGLATGFGSSKSKVITLEAFAEGLQDRVNNWVRVHRHASQTPRFLMADTKTNPQLFGIAENPTLPELRGVDQADLSDKFRLLNENWNQLSKFTKCAWIDPMLYAKVESQLVQMEDLAEANVSERWRNFQENVSGDLNNLTESCTYARQVSLVEAELHSAVYPSRVISEKILAEGKTQDASWLVSPPWLQTPIESVDPKVAVKSLPRNDRCYQVWTYIDRAAASEGATEWERAFNKTSLRKCLDYIGALDSASKADWLEIQLLRIFSEEIQWDRQAAGVSQVDIAKSCAMLIRTYSTIQEIAMAANPELSRCLEKDIQRLDAEFYKSFDFLVTNEFKASFDTLKKIEKEVRTLKDDKDLLARAMSVRDRAFHRVPHLLAFWMRSYRYSDTEGDRMNANEQAKHLGETIQQATLIKDALGKAQDFVRTAVDSDLLSKLEQTLDKAEKDVDGGFAALATKEADDQQVIRDCRVALRYPLLSDKLRTQFHETLIKFYTKRNAGSTTAATRKGASDGLGNRDDDGNRVFPPSDIAKVFISNLGSIAEKANFEEVVFEDARFQHATRIEMPSDQGNFEAKFYAMYLANCNCRLIANSFGQRAFAKRWEIDNWPWNAPAQFRELNTAIYCKLQSQRLYQAKWGDGELDAARMNVQRLYFQRLASPFLDKVLDHRRGYVLASDIKAWGEDLARQETEAFDKIAKLEVLVAPINPSIDSESQNRNKSEVRFDVTGDQWPATAAAYLGSRANGEDRKTSDSRAISIPLDLKDVKNSLDVDVNAIDQRKMYLSVRGHYLAKDLELQLPGGKYRLTFERDKTAPTVLIEAKNDNPTTVLILLDCSDSMGARFVEAKNCAIQLLDQLAKLHEVGEATFKIGVIVFGLVPSDNIPLEKEWKESKYGNHIFQIQPAIANSNFIEFLRKRVGAENIYSGGCTPLYDALYAASDLAEGSESRIVVISDGFNEITPKLSDGSVFYKGEDFSFETIEKRLKQIKSSALSIFQFSTEYYQNKDIAAFNLGKEKLKRICKDLNFYGSFDSLSKELLASFPKSYVKITGNESVELMGRFSEPIEIPTSALPFKGIVHVHSFDYQGLPQQAERPIEILGNEQMRLVYQNNRNELSFIPFSEDILAFNDRGEARIKLSDVSGMKSENSFEAVLRKITRPSHQLAIHMAVLGRDPRIERENQVLRPKFLVAKVSPPATGVGRTLLLSDRDFRASHYPVLQFNGLPWERAGDWQSKEVLFDIWYSHKIPSFAKKIQLSDDNDEQTLEDGQVRCKKINGTVTVEIEPRDRDRFFVLCENAEKAERIYDEGATDSNRESTPIREIHKFTWSVPPKSADVWLVRQSDVERSDAADLMHFRCQWNDR
ncbi:MAG: vWA domain-containing protein [Pirellulaceae bacterium]|nr:vWA domain-containing protein [Pirellulaceae bacterium]